MVEGKKMRLGRGLDHLIASGMPQTVPNNVTTITPNLIEIYGEVRELAIDQIIPNAKQARRKFDEKAIQELADSIAAQGLLQPIIVCPTPNGYFSIVAGERRFRAMQILGKSSITAKVVNISEADCAIISLIENLQRESLNPIEEAWGFLRLVDEFGLTQEQIAQKVGKARTTIANALRLLHLEKEALNCLELGKITVGHAKVLLGLEDPTTRLLLLEKIITADLNVRQTERQANILKLGKPTPMPSNPRELSESLMKIEKQIAQQLAANVSLQHGSTHGKIIIEYNGEQELLRIVQSMGIE
ncbi:MAG: ParB/RepB/Spo0J family partition protein [Puniceicoccales bacterium]|jgi:ParB family chromosome partitioning protein|nr:ParB/RepB/Spo0J family partition protein [Puniceicoccales bacterium]